MVRAWWALAFILLLVALPAGGPEYQDGRGQSSQDTSKVLHEILGQLKTIARGASQLQEPALSTPTAGQKPAEYLQERLNKDQQHNRLGCTGSKFLWVPLRGLGVPWVLMESNLPLILTVSDLIFTICIIHSISNSDPGHRTLLCFWKLILIPPKREEELFCAGDHALE
ncbi:uncharacterized protein LOC116799585 isoform X3 [Chiroxiphia lanceolata]|uniref:uncharacterized protein LOC116799585 isoform X3 n=1 Tax=Chiroxiphia lanceolata TaxID=296741 RepID=UPI0013CEC6EA|nr:uncharacterized protein LOC116799585 isoform X3 [Chiroxiphia lanceolata]